MKKFFFKRFLVFLFILTILIITPKAYASSYMADKNELTVDLEISGVESICQTDDGYVWIGQFSGLLRYDSNEFVSFKEFVDDGVKYEIINVTKTIANEKTVYIATPENIIKYENNVFKKIFNYRENPDYSDEFPNEGKIKNFNIDFRTNMLYICTLNRGLVLLDMGTKNITTNENARGKTVYQAFVDSPRNRYFYELNDGIYKNNGEKIFDSQKVTEVYLYKDRVFFGEDAGKLYVYDLITNSVVKEYDTTDQINKILYSEKDDILFVACDKKGLYCYNLTTDDLTIADNLENKSMLVDLMIDYEGNLWIASHNVSASGLSIITKNALSSLLYDDVIWNSLELPPSVDRNIYAIEKINNIIYICTPYSIYLYDVEQGKIIENDILNTKLNEYFDSIGITTHTALDVRDVEEFNGCIYFASYKYGIIEYNKTTNAINIYDPAYIESHTTKSYNDPVYSVTNTVRSLRAFDDFLAIGYSKGIMVFDGTNFIVNRTESNVLYINKTNDGKIIFNRTSGLFTVNDDLSDIKEIETAENISGNRLRFLVDGDYIYYNLNSRLFRLENVDGKNVSKEIIIPFIKGSIVNISKVKIKNEANEYVYKYIIVSQTQIYITDSLEVDKLENYELLDSTNGLQAVLPNSSGFYDETNERYYFQTSNGIFEYDFDTTKTDKQPLKVAVNSVTVDKEVLVGTELKLDKNVDRVTFNLSVFSFKPNKGYKVYYKLDGVDKTYHEVDGSTKNVSYTNLKGGKYAFHFYVVDENGKKSNVVNLSFSKNKHVYEYVWFVLLIVLLALAVLIGGIVLFFMHKVRIALKQEEEYKKITLESIEAIARTIDVKDAYTNGHSRRVGYYSREIAKAMGLSEKEVENIFYTALLHDIGKIGIPIKIINKPSRLDDEEFEVMKTHTTKGGKILKDISTIPGIVEGAMYHHEKYDGRGYPTGLKGEDIPLNARIICCADCFDAMATRRSYKEPCTKEYIINEFKRCSGTQFDPEIAKVMIKLIEEDKFKTILEEDKKHKNDDVVTIEDSKDGE